MPQDWTNLVGGLAQGLVGGKNAAKAQAIQEAYKNEMINQSKWQQKHIESQIRAADFENQLLKTAMGSMSGGQPQPSMTAPSAPAVPPVSQAQPSIPNMVAQGQTQGFTNPMNPTGGQAPPISGGGLVNMDPSGQTSYRNKNIYNVKYAPTQDKFGGSPDTGDTKNRNFTAYPSLEAGVAAGTDLIQRKYAPMTVTQGLLTYAPPSENPNIYQRISEVSKAFNIDPNKTTIGELPLAPFMTILAKQESPTQINPAIWGDAGSLPINQTVGKMPWDQQIQAQQTGQNQPQKPSLNMPQRGQLTPQKFLEGYMKKKWGVEPDQVTISSYGDHKLVTDKKEGTPLFIIAGQGKTEMVDVTQPDGSVIKRPMLVPPSPLPGGIPVINMAGQAGNMPAGVAQVKPPEVTREEITLPNGAKVKVPVGKPQLGGESIPTEPPKGSTAADAGKLQSIIGGLQDGKSFLQKMVNDKGEVNDSMILGMSVPFTLGVGQARGALGEYRNAVDAIVRQRTGAQIRADEWPYYDSIYKPTVMDPANIKKDKISRLNRDLQGALNLVDPNNSLRDRSSPALTPQSTRGMQAPATGGLPPGAVFKGTSNGKKVYQLPDGRGYIE